MREFSGIVEKIFKGMASFFSLKFFPAFIIPVFGILFGFTTSNILEALFALIVFDFITGVLSAYHTGEPIRSKGIVRTSFKIAVYGLLVSAGHLSDTISPFPAFIQDAITTFLALTELISIIENVGKMGYAIPKKLLYKLQRLRDEETMVIEKTTVKEKTDPITNMTEKHTILEKTTETHVVETPTSVIPPKQ